MLNYLLDTKIQEYFDKSVGKLKSHRSLYTYATVLDFFRQREIYIEILFVENKIFKYRIVNMKNGNKSKYIKCSSYKEALNKAVKRACQIFKVRSFINTK